jgi:hypothetical protein
VFRRSERAAYDQAIWVEHHQPRKRYGFFKFLADCVLILLTHGFWLIWIFIREMRGRRR